MGRPPCCEKNGLKKGPWTPEEDQKLIDYIQKHGCGNWRTLPKNAGLQRCGKSCRLRWTNYLRPDIKRGKFSFEEEETIIQLHGILGNKWSAIAARLPGRTDNEIKNYWNTRIRKRLLRMGIDPVTHSPRLDLLDLSSILGSSLYNNQSQMNISRLLGVDSFVNPELLRLAALMSSQRDHDRDQNKYQAPLMQLNHEIPACTYDAQVQLMNMEQFPSNFSDLNDWQGNATMPSYVPLPLNYDYYGPDQISVLSTPSSSPAPVNSNSKSTYIINNNNNNNEDERDSYCSDILNFEIPDILNVNDFMLGP